MSHSHSNSSESPSQVVGIQFSILSPEEIRKASVAEITSRDTYINNKPIIGGLFDPRMGVLEAGLICPTDGHDFMTTPGYFGHIELARPVFHIQYLATVLKILRCVCFKCSKLKISKEKYKQALKLVGDQRWKYVFSMANKVKKCGEDIDDGCGCLQPTKIRKEGLAILYAEWKNSGEEGNIILKLIPELVLKIFKRISDEDVAFMGFSPVWSRPDWMICQVMIVPPPAVRPSVKHDAQQRSEDDLSHILVEIIKANKTLQEKINSNAPPNIIDDWVTVLQYFIASQVDNKIPGSQPVAQRSGRPLKSLKDRLNGKGGRMRGNLMAKRVDFSARSVITADPNISIRELGIPMKIAMNITKPVVVNDRNRNYLLQLVTNGPDIHPGAKILQKKGGDSITLRYIDRSSIRLQNGDIVHRHMQDGDPILFNRQPTLHRMSMMCHLAKVMRKGDTFRMNVADTKPYNADFDGDEMNWHMPQDAEADAELFNLAAVPYQIVSPANNTAIIGIYQDSMVGSYRFTRENIQFDARQAMNLLMMFPGVNEVLLHEALARKGHVSNFDILTQIMPPISLKYKTKHFGEGDDMKTSNSVIEISNGHYVRGQLEKGVLGSRTKGLLQRICNDFGNFASADFIDNLQNIVTAYLNTSSYSVGISDLISYQSDAVNHRIVEIITRKKADVQALIEQAQIGVFENNTGKTNNEEFETQVNNILNQASAEAGKVGLKSLSKENRFVIMVNAGSKGSDLNISQMISCLGQQNVDGKRIPYGFDNRTLPHYAKYDDSPGARGFVESSYINGLSPQELFFHAMGGRVGIIDTAVKTSSTGYIQRRLVKAMEDLMVCYDMTVRTNKGKIVEFKYGDDGIDPMKVESQVIDLVKMGIQDVYAHFNLPDESSKARTLSQFFLKSTYTRLKKQSASADKKMKYYTEFMLTNRDLIVKNVFKNKSDDIVSCPVAFAFLIANVVGQQHLNANSIVDFTILEAFEMIEHSFSQLERILSAPPTLLFKTLYFFYLSPKDLLVVKRFNKASLTILLETIVLSYKRAIVAPGEMVGMIAAQSIGEPTTQMTLNTFHFAGVASKSNVTRGVPRIEEILSLSSEPKNPSLTVFLKPEEETDREKAQTIMYMLEHTKLRDVVLSIDIYFDPDDLGTLIEEDSALIVQYKVFESMVAECADVSLAEPTGERSKWILRMEMNAEVMLEKNITMDDIHYVLKNSYGSDISCIYSDYNADKLIFRIRMNNVLKGSKSASKKSAALKVAPLDQSDQIYILKNFQENLLNNIILRGIKGLNKVILRTIKDNLVENSGAFIKQDIWVLDTVGTNILDVLSLDYIDASRTVSNDINEIFHVFGIEAARQTIYNELAEVIEFDGTYVNYHHMCMLCDRMTYTQKMISIFRHGINNDNIGPIAKASFEETPEMFLKAARHAELDIMRGVSANVMCGQEGLYGTSSFQVLLDTNAVIDFAATAMEAKQDLESFFKEKENPTDKCSSSKLEVQNSFSSIATHDLGHDDDDYDAGF